MGKFNERPDGTGVVQGDSRPMPDRGTGTGFNGDTYGADVSPEATNRQGRITGATQSHAAGDRPGSNNRKGC